MESEDDGLSKYKVIGPKAITGHQPGDSFESDDPAMALNVGAHLERVAVKVVCPACEEQGKSRPPRFDSHEALLEHYGKTHAGLVPPDKEE